MTARVERWAAWAAAAILAIVLFYGLWSLRDLAMRWGFDLAAVAAVLLWSGIAALGLILYADWPRRRWFSLMAATAMAARVAFGLLAVGRSTGGDPHAYLELAKHLLDTGELAIYETYFGGVWRALFPPLYPLLLAGWGAVWGFSTPSQLALNTLTDGTAAIVLALIGKRLGRADAGRVAGWLYFIWPSVLFSAPLAQKEGLCALLILLLAYVWLTRFRRRWAQPLLIGVLAGALALCQPGEVPIAGLFGLALIPRDGWRRVFITGLSAAPAFIMVLIPWWIRNWLVLGAFVPLTSASGASLWIGNNPQATGNWMPPPPELHGLPELVYGKRIGAIAREWIVQHPFGVVRLAATKFLRAFGIGAFGVTRLMAMQPPIAPWLATLLWPLSALAHLAMLTIGAVGTVRLPRSGGGLLALLIVACLVQLLVFGLWFEFGERHREFVTPLLLLAIAWLLPPVGNEAPSP